MADDNAGPKVKVPRLEPVPYVVAKTKDGKTVLRHPDELKRK